MVWKANDSVLGTINKNALAFAGASSVVAVDVESFIRGQRQYLGWFGLLSKLIALLLEYPGPTHNSLRCREAAIDGIFGTIEHHETICMAIILRRGLAIHVIV